MITQTKENILLNTKIKRNETKKKLNLRIRKKKPYTEVIVKFSE